MQPLCMYLYDYQFSFANKRWMFFKRWMFYVQSKEVFTIIHNNIVLIILINLEHFRTIHSIQKPKLLYATFFVSTQRDSTYFHHTTHIQQIKNQQKLESSYLEIYFGTCKNQPIIHCQLQSTKSIHTTTIFRCSVRNIYSFEKIPQMEYHYQKIIINMYKQLLLVFLVALVIASRRTPDSKIGTFKGQKSLIELYYQTQCPYCTKFMTNQLAEIIKVPGIFDIVDFQLYPFGNGKIIRNGRDQTFTCQHGQTECQGNMIASCALNMYPQQKSVPFAVCLQQSSSEWEPLGQTCAKSFGMDWSMIESCTNSYEGQQIQYYSALATKAAQVRSVPSLFFDGVAEEQFQFQVRDNLLYYACASYKGSKSIKACEKF